ncbi:MAG: hypothetical protein NTW24_00990 [Proteobacteria bacterium]|nr:hypothetical protein [Pseudomonadota bacterium]
MHDHLSRRPIRRPTVLPVSMAALDGGLKPSDALAACCARRSFRNWALGEFAGMQDSCPQHGHTSRLETARQIE